MGRKHLYLSGRFNSERKFWYIHKIKDLLVKNGVPSFICEPVPGKTIEEVTKDAWRLLESHLCSFTVVFGIGLPSLSSFCQVFQDLVFTMRSPFLVTLRKAWRRRRSWWRSVTRTMGNGL